MQRAMKSLKALVLVWLFVGPLAPYGFPSATGIDANAIDRSVSPCDDFYQYACGNWIKETVLPADKGRFARSFNSIDDRNLDTLHSILENYRNGKYEPRTKYAGKLGVFYGSCMDEKSAEGLAPETVKGLIAGIERSLSGKNRLTDLIKDFHAKGIDTIFSMGAMQDQKDSSRVIAEFEPGGMGLPTKDYYLLDTPKMKEMREKYRKHVARMLVLAGKPDGEAKASADAILRFETELAKVSLSPAERRDPKRTENPGTIKNLEKDDAALAWKEYFEFAGIRPGQKINIEQPAYFKGLSQAMRGISPAALKDYFLYRELQSLAFELGKRFDEESFKFVSNLTGQKRPEARWKRCIRLARRELRDAVAEAFVLKTFGKDGKMRTQAMIDALKAAFAKTLKTESWLNPKVQEVALGKLRAFRQKIGYPDPYRRYDAVQVKPGHFVENVLSASRAEVRRDWKKIGKPTDRKEWEMGADAVNAYYDPQKNEIVFPAGILQPPFFSVHASDGFNFGGIGMVIGHEMTHGFDDQGSQFDKNGNLKEWWPKSIRQEFTKKAACVKNEYAGYTVLDGLHIKGDLTLGENLADNGGLKLAWLAYQATKKKHAPVASPATSKGGFNEDQEFFLAFAQSWCMKYADNALRSQVETDPHSPSRFRVDGVIVNTPAFGRVFGCAEGTKMAPKNRCAVW